MRRKEEKLPESSHRSPPPPSCCKCDMISFLQITDDIETIKSEMEERGSSMTDGSPLVNIRKNLARVRQEILGMDVRIGVLEHTVMQARLRDR